MTQEEARVHLVNLRESYEQALQEHQTLVERGVRQPMQLLEQLYADRIAALTVALDRGWCTTQRGGWMATMR